MANTFETADVVDVKIKGSVKGVTAISKKAKAVMVILAFFVLCFVLFAIFTIGDSEDKPAADSEKAAQEERKKATNEPARGDVILKGVGDGNAAVSSPVPAFDLPTGATGVVPGTPAVDLNSVPNTPATSPQVPNLSMQAPAGKGSLVPAQPMAPVQPTVPALTPEQIAAKELLTERETQRKAAIRAGMEVSGVEVKATGGSLAAGAPFASMANAGSGGGNAAGGSFAQFANRPGPQEQDDQNKQVRKESFLRDAESKSSEFYLKESKYAAKSPYELKMGWKIPAFLIDGIDSDLPGQTCAMVREDVYDSISGKYLLVPQGTKLCGTYDSQIAVGQERLLMVWNRLIFEDGSSINIAGMPGTDQAGYAGFDAEVDNHYVRVFGGAIMMSIISAGAQLSQPRQAANSNSAPTAGQTAAAALGQQLGQVGSALVQRDLRIQPTLKQRPGYRFNIQITRDIVFPGPWKRNEPKPR